MPRPTLQSGDGESKPVCMHVCMCVHTCVCGCEGFRLGLERVVYLSLSALLP